MDKKEMDFLVAPNQANQANPAKKQKVNPTAILVVVVGLIVLAIFVIRPALLGYGIYQRAEASNLTVQDYAQNMQQLNRDLEVTKTNLSSYSTFTGALMAQVDKKSDELIECKVALERIQLNVEVAQKQVAEKEIEVATVKSETEKTIDQLVTEKTAALEQEKTVCESSLVEKETEVGEVQAKYDTLVKNTAKSICCKVKVDNPQINFYDVVDNKITCLEQGTNQLSC
ncbi:MAG: hypothetical protein AABX24_05565 [Nanoarchaeota archaeon]